MGCPKEAHINTIARTEPGDTLLIYVGQQVVDKETTLPPAITGCFEITSTVYEDSSRIFTAPPNLGNEIFPGVKLQPVMIFDPPIEFKPLIPNLAFITNKKQWSGHIRGQTIPEENYRLIMSQG
ncbi:EVE domain-containing protein [Methanoculleus receptaculi]|jgi:predicted RNA-binding protein|uniref:EVE domain-containing protein n=1 Tax=Methanoculleus receptaculi TaxID=394967 RepID=A0AAX4FTU5_9EURY|nr:EVE domain-containing protein [Methanoculleus receptaculi]WOX57320.1 EVE domain-containing protein [Methanoculleus receptaculi]